MGVCPLLLLLSLALGASAQDHVPITSTNRVHLHQIPFIIHLLNLEDFCTILNKVFFFLGPPKITVKPTDPPVAPSLNFTVATQAQAGPPTTLAPAVIPVTTITTTTATTTTTTVPAVGDDVKVVGPNGTGRLLPFSPPPAPTDAPQAPPTTEPPPPPTPAGGDNGTADYVPDTPATETYTDDDGDIVTEETEATTEPGLDSTSDTTPHGECVCLFRGVCSFNVRIHHIYPP